MARDAGVGGAERAELGPLIDVTVGEVINLSHPPTLPREPEKPALICTVRAGPGEQSLDRPGVDHIVHRHRAESRPLAAVAEPVELAGSVRVGVDAELAARLDGHGQ